MAPKDKASAVSLTSESASGDSQKNKKHSKDGKDASSSGDAALSDDDRELKERLEACVATICGTDGIAAGEAGETVAPPPSPADPLLRLKALEMVATELRTATASMTSVPKPLKFLRPHFAALHQTYQTLLVGPKGEGSTSPALLELRARLADVLAVLAMTMATEERQSLKLRLEAAQHFHTLQLQHDDPGTWGHEYVRSLAGELGEEYQARLVAGVDPDDAVAFADLEALVDVVVPFHLTHNAEAEAIDLLIEVQGLKKLLSVSQIDDTNYQRICLYLLRTADYMSDPDDLMVSSVCVVVVVIVEMGLLVCCSLDPTRFPGRQVNYLTSGLTHSFFSFSLSPCHHPTGNAGNCV